MGQEFRHLHGEHTGMVLGLTSLVYLLNVTPANWRSMSRDFLALLHHGC